MAQGRIDRLDNIGFKWALKEAVSTAWTTRFKELVQYKANHGDCNISTKQGQLGKWVGTQRTNYRKGKLSQDRIDRLNGIGFDWTPPRGGSRKRKAPPSTRKQSLSRKVHHMLPVSSDHPVSAPTVMPPSRRSPRRRSPRRRSPRRSRDSRPKPSSAGMRE